MTSAHQTTIASQSLDQAALNLELLQKTGFIEKHFPLFHALFLQKLIPTIFGYPFLFLYFGQCLFIVAWPWLKYMDAERDNKLMRWLFRVLLFLDSNPSDNNYLFAAIGMWICAYSTVFLIQFQLFYYNFQRKFVSFLNYPIRLYYDTFLVWHNMPAMIGTFQTLLKLFRGEANTKIVFAFIFYAMGYFYMIISFTMVHLFAAKSIYVWRWPLLNFDPLLMIYTIWFNLSMIAFFHILTLFEHWAPLVAVFIHMIGFAWLGWYLFANVSFVDIIFQSMGIAWFFSCSVSDFVVLLASFIPKIFYFTPIGASVTCLCLLSGFMLFFNIFRYRWMKKRLSVERASQEEYYDYYDSIGLGENEGKALAYLKIGFQYYCPCFYNWTLMNYIVERYKSERALGVCLHLITFFPKESRLQNKIEKEVLANRNIFWPVRFLIYEIEHLKTLRNFQNNSAMKLKLVELKTNSRQCEMMCRSAVDSTKLNAEFFEMMGEAFHQTRALWKEAIIDSPNNAKYYEEYSRYLCEAECDFVESLIMKNRQNAIESGSSFSVDMSFRSMVRAFPQYLTKKIVDLQGRIIKNVIPEELRNSASVTANTTISNGTSSSSFSSALDNDVEDHLGRITFKMSRVRLALQRTLSRKMPKPILLIKEFSVFLIIALPVIFGLSWYKTKSILLERVNNMQLLDELSLTRFYCALSNLDLILMVFKRAPFVPPMLQQMKKLMRETDIPYIDPYTNNLTALLNFTNRGSSYYQNLINRLTDLAIKGEDVNNYAAILLTEKLLAHTCNEGNIVGNFDTYPSSLGSLIAMYLTNQRLLSSLIPSEIADPFSNPNICELSSNYMAFFQGSSMLLGNISDAQDKRGQEFSFSLLLIEIFMPILTFIFAFVPFIVIHFSINRSLNEIIKLIQSLDIKAKNEAKEMMLFHKDSDDLRMTDFLRRSRKSLYLIATICFVMMLLCFICFAACETCMQSNKDIEKLNRWNKYATSRLSMSAESFTMMTMYILTVLSGDQYVTTSKETILRLASFVLTSLEEADQALVDGTKNSPPCFGYNVKLDLLNVIGERLEAPTMSPSDFYVDASAHQMIQIYISYARSILKAFQLPNGPGTAWINDLMNALYLSNYRMYNKLYQVTSLLMSLGSQRVEDQRHLMIIFICLTFVCLIILGVSVLFYHRNRVQTYRAALMVIKRFSPYTLINSKLFEKIFLHGKGDDKSEKLSIEGQIIKIANDAVVCTNLYGVVEIVNNSTTSMIGFTADQILGQNIVGFFKDEDSKKMLSKMDQMRNGQSSSFFEDDFILINDTNEEIVVKVSIFGMKKDDSSDVNSFVVIMKDQNKLFLQKQQAEEAKAKSENLLYQILPRDIVLQINRGEKEISFEVPFATVIFIDIDKFSEYAANLNPQGIMNNLSFYFSCIDKIAAKYNLIQKIKLIGDIYMAASGLFNQDIPAEQHADQAILFGQEVISHMEEVNLRLVSSLSIRVGINSGGPLIAGVLGKDKPAFDIVGDTINIAARLQTTAEPNHVHISQATLSLVSNMNYDVIARGETFLKGKGRELTFYIKPNNPVFSALGSTIYQ